MKKYITLMLIKLLKIAIKIKTPSKPGGAVRGGNSMIERKCPNCGGVAKVKPHGVEHKTYYCQCESCGLRTRYNRSTRGAIDDWTKGYLFFQITFEEV